MFILASILCLLGTAHAAVMVRKVSELDDDEKVQMAAKRYRVFASAYVIYEQCGNEYPVVATDRDYVKEQFAAAELAYREAYHNAYVKRVGFPPDVPTEQDYVARIRRTQQLAVNNTAATIQQQGCRQYLIKNMVDFVTKARRPDPVREDE